MQTTSTYTIESPFSRRKTSKMSPNLRNDATNSPDVSYRSNGLPTPIFYNRNQNSLSTKREKRNQSSRFQNSMKRFCATDVRMRSNLGNTSETSFRKNTAQVLNLGGDSYKLGNFIENSKLYDSRSQSTFFRQTFTVKGTLGKGSFGEVFSVTSKEDNLDYALKRSLCCLRSEQDQKEAHEEVKKMQSIPHHANILRIHRAWEQKGKIYMQLDLCEKSLDDIAVIGQKVSDDDIWRYFADILLGVHHLHSNGFIHMDIKASNILIDSYGICKLADFGLMIDTKYQKHKSFHGEGDSRYLAPEILNEDPTYAADIFSFGMTMLELATDLDLPTHGDGWNILRTGQFPERFKSEVSKDLAFVILQMIQPDKFERPSSADLLRNKLLKDRVGRRQSDHFYYNTLQFFKKFIPSFLTFESKTSQSKTPVRQIFGENETTPLSTPPFTRTPEPRGRCMNPRVLSFNDSDIFDLQSP